MTGAPEVSVIIPARNAAATIGQQLTALAAQDFAGTWEVLVVDNGSTDDLAAVVDDFSGLLPDLRVIPASGRAGVPHARNCGARAARADLLALCDADDEVEPGWLRAMVAGLQHCDHVGGLVDELALNDPVVLAWKRPRKRDGLQIALELLPYATGASCGVRRAVFDAIGGWDETYVCGGNDVEFSFRVQLAGFRLCWVPDAVVHYRLRRSLRAHAGKSFRTAVADVHLLRDFERFGARGRPWRTRLRTWAKLVAITPAACVRERERGLWVGMAAQELGRAWGLVVHRRGRRRAEPMAPS
jgi:glycosyltransferase involved in cell wall biosynthesis